MELVQASEVFEQDFQAFLYLSNFQKSMNNNIKHRQKPETDVAEVRMVAAGLFLGRELLRILPVKLQVLLVPIRLVPMVGRVVFDEVRHPVAKFRRFQQHQLDDEGAYLKKILTLTRNGDYQQVNTCASLPS